MPPGAPDDAVVDLILETETGYRMYSYTGGRWMDYGTQRKDDNEGPPDDRHPRELPRAGRRSG